MKIARITVWAVDLPFTKPYWLSGGRVKVAGLDSTFVRVETEDGRAGWGEGCPWGPSYLPACGPSLRGALEILGPALIGEDPRALEHVNRVMDAALPGHPHAKSPLDVACWDLLGQESGQPLWRLLGAAEPADVPLNASISTGTPDEMIALIEEARAEGYRVHSAKVGGADPAADIARIDAIAEALPQGHSVTFDVNRAWTPAVALQVLGAVDTLAWVEQPCETLEQCAQVAAKVRQPVLLDESLLDFRDHLEAHRLGAFTGLKIKPNRAGGLTRARQIRDFALHVGWRAHVEDLGGSALADTAAIHLAAATPEPYRMASWLSSRHLSVDPVPGQGARNLGGFTRPPATSGLGVAPDPDALGRPAAVYEARP